ncbi:MAG TPA: hypothetical protein VD997_12840 [Phycisphaerales bacterium]|nr:hypothetical protein [Phycisphaerales bacterium]
MKSLWTVLSVLAVANLVALMSFVGWLAKSDRLSMDRVRAVREVIAKPISLERSELEQAAKEQEAANAKAEAEARAGRPPLTAAEKLQARIEATEIDRQRIERLKREVADLQMQLAAEGQRLRDERAAFEAEKKQFDQVVASLNAGTSDAQFQKTLKILTSAKPQQAVTLLLQMLEPAAPPPELTMVPVANGAEAPQPAPAGPNEQQIGAVVEYLDAMGDKQRAKIMESLTKTDPKLAADLLERLRKRGEFARVP